MDHHSKIRDYLEGFVACLILTAGMGWAWTIGEERQERALAEEQAEIEQEHVRVAHEQREAAGNLNVWRRICIDGENWSSSQQRCVAGR